MNFLYFILACYGLTSIITRSDLLEPYRNPDSVFIHCPACVGFWVGVFVSMFFNFFELNDLIRYIAGTTIFGFISSGTSYALCNLIGDVGFRMDMIHEKFEKK